MQETKGCLVIIASAQFSRALHECLTSSVDNTATVNIYAEQTFGVTFPSLSAFWNSVNNMMIMVLFAASSSIGLYLNYLIDSSTTQWGERGGLC